MQDKDFINLSSISTALFGFVGWLSLQLRQAVKTFYRYACSKAVVRFSLLWRIEAFKKTVHLTPNYHT
jgi:hypothetical protein